MSRNPTVDYPTAPGVACLTCGAEAVGVKAHGNGFDYCRHCYYVGSAYEDMREDQLEDIRRQLPDWIVTIEHTGGGCFWLAFYPPGHDLGQFGGDFYAASAGEATLPEEKDGSPRRDGWGLACRYNYDEDSPRYEETGEIVAEGTPDYDDRYPDGSLTDAELVAAIRSHWEKTNA